MLYLQIHDDNGVSYAEDQDVSWEHCDQHDEVRLPAEGSLRSNNSIGKPSQGDKLIDLHDLGALLASFRIQTLHTLKYGYVIYLQDIVVTEHFIVQEK
ncbi:hypothetical protein SLE2022_280350 [Rubroshorea leprosula]